MASIFLSYDHEDRDRARPIAVALEKAGHSVWWDRHIKSGAQYSEEIDEALKRAEAVVVLWSEKSIASPWVRDEAAAGRDSGKLVPALISAVEPPLGFRQYQTTDLTRWKGRARAPEFREMLEALEPLAGKEPLIAAAKPARISAIENHDWTRRWLSPWLIVGLLILVIGLVVARPWEGKASIPAVTVVPSDQTAKSRAIAGNLLVQLGSLQLANADALQLIEPQSGAKPDMTFKVGAVGEPGALHINLALIDNRGEALLWSREFVQPGGNEADLRQQLAYSAGQVLRCALDALNTKGKRLRQQTLKLYLNACATYAETSGGIDSGPVVPMFRQVIREAPDFEGGWRALLLSETDAFLGSGKEQMREQLQKDVAAARKVNPNLVEIFQAEIDLLPANAFADRMRLADKAVAIDPDNALSYAVRGGVLLHIGHMYGAVEDTLKAVQLDPLSPPLRDAYIQALLYAGRTDLALQELHEAEQLWPGATNLAEARWRIDLRYGDAREALRALQVDPRAGGWESGPSYLEARIDPSPTKVQRAIDDVLQGYKKYPRTIGHLAQVFGEFGREAELLDLLLHAPRGVAIGGVEVMFRPALIDFWNDPRSLQFAKRVGLLQFWRSSGKWPDFCNQSDLPYDCKEEAAKLAA